MGCAKEDVISGSGQTGHMVTQRLMGGIGQRASGAGSGPNSRLFWVHHRFVSLFTPSSLRHRYSVDPSSLPLVAPFILHSFAQSPCRASWPKSASPSPTKVTTPSLPHDIHHPRALHQPPVQAATQYPRFSWPDSTHCHPARQLTPVQSHRMADAPDLLAVRT